MKLVVFGATGMAGSAVTDEAAQRGHRVLAVSRSPKHSHRDRVTTRAMNVADTDRVELMLTDVDAAVVAVRPSAGSENLLPALTESVLDAATRSDTPIVIVGGSSPLWSPTSPGVRLIDDPRYVPEEWQDVARASLHQFEVCLRHRYKRWTYVSPSAIFLEGPRTWCYVRGTNTLLIDETKNSQVTNRDLAAAVLDEIEEPRGVRHFTVITPQID